MSNPTLGIVNQKGKPWRLIAGPTPRALHDSLMLLPGASARPDGCVTFPLDPFICSKIWSNLNATIQPSPEVSEWLEACDQHAERSVSVKHQQDALVFGGDRLYPYQRVGVQWLKTVKRGILGDEMGLGKTVQALYATAGMERVLIVAPALAKRNVWERQIKKWLGIGPHVYVADGETPARMLTVTAGLHGTPPTYVIVNPEMIRVPWGEQRFGGLWRQSWDAVILDEAHRYQDKGSQQSKGAAKLKSEHLFLLTGTPVWSKPENVWHLLHLIDPKRWSSYQAFVSEYCEVMTTYWASEIVGIKPWMQEQLNLVLDPFLLRRLQKDELPDLPDVTVEDLSYKLSSAQAPVYRQLKRKYELTIAGKGTELVRQEPSISKTFADLRRFVNAPSLVDPAYADVRNAKDEVLDELVGQALGEKRKVVVFTWHNDYGHYLQKRLHNFNRDGSEALLISGDTPQRERERALEHFQDPDHKHHADILIASIPIASEAIDLTAASVCIFAEGHYVPSVNNQAIKRLHRPGQKDNVLVYRLMGKDTVEEAVWHTADSRQEAADEMLAFATVARLTLAQEYI